MKNYLDYNLAFEIYDNPLNLKIEDYLVTAIRENTKRRFLFISKKLGKHLACKPKEMDEIGRLIVEAYKLKNKPQSGTVISFAETGTAIGHSVFDHIEGDYEFVHTTREIIDGYNSFEFLEEHSHATDHKLYLDNLKKIKNKDEVILVDDEITSGKTCINLIRCIASKYKKNKFIICAILNWMNDVDLENMRKVEEELNISISFVYLFRGNFNFNLNYIKEDLINKETANKKIKNNEKNKQLKVNYINIDMKDYLTSNKYIKYTGRFGINKEEQKYLKEIVKRESKKIKTNNEKVLVLGTEEYMYIPMIFAKELGENVLYHSTTRSPIIEIEDKDYPINTKFSFKSFYNKNIDNYLYNIDNYDYKECFVFVEQAKPKEDFKEMVNIFRNTSIETLNFVLCSK